MGRIEPLMPAANYQTYSISAPRATHFRPATCAEIDCPNYISGWTTTVDLATPLGMAQFDYITQKSGRHFISRREGTLIVFHFECGQSCFAEHTVPLEREPLFIVRGGDFRGNPRGDRRVHTRPDDWVDDFANHQQTLADEHNKG